jgi:hypothetical protein
MRQRVRVHDGNNENLLGEGYYVGDVPVYAFQDPNTGVLVSMADATQPLVVPPGCIKHDIPSNPKIELDDGTVVYGCQVWWEPIPDAKSILNEFNAAVEAAGLN